MSSDVHSSLPVTERLAPADIEHRLRGECYEAVLPGVHVGSDDDLFALGGDSIMLMRLVSMAQISFGIEINALRFFESPTLGTLSAEVQAGLTQATSDDGLADILAQLESMTDEDVRRILNDE